MIEPIGFSPFAKLRSRSLILALVLAFAVGAFGSFFLGDIGIYIADLILLAWIMFVISRFNISLRALVGWIPANYSWWPLILMAVAMLFYATGAITVIIYGVAQVFPEFGNELLAETLAESRVHLFITTVVLAPILEETIFRGLLFSRLTVKWGLLTGIMVSSFVFGLLHFISFIGASVMGVVLCVLYLKTRTLLIPMALHALYNFIVFSATFVESEQMMTQTSPEFWSQFVYQGLIAVMFASPVVFFLLARWWPAAGTPLPYETNLASGKT
jgi:membrane protease YdiL (CAAX protease family)